jgi:alpha-tubulin suppressor-like RCC1 family protein
MPRLHIAAAAAALLLVLSACGGGDSLSPNTNPPPPPPPNAAVKSIELTPTSGEVAVGRTLQLSATPRDASGNALTGRTVSWTSAAANVASVDANGVVTGVAAGTATITATSEGVSGTATLTVQVPVATVTVTPGLDTLEAWEPRTMLATLLDTKGNVLTGRVVRWSSSNPAIAMIDSLTGQLTGVERGTVTVTATSEGTTGSTARVIVIKYRSISAGAMHACDIASGGIVWCWGLNGREGRIGGSSLGDNSLNATPIRVPSTGAPNDVRFTQLSTYGIHTCALASDGKAYCWGSNSWSRLGNDAAGSQSFTPVAVTGGLAFAQISVGSEHSCALTSDGRAYCWGHNDWGQFAMSAPGSTQTPTAVAPQYRFASLSAGSNFTCGVTTGGQSYCWGGSGSGQLGDGGTISYTNTYSVTPRAVVGSGLFKSVDGGGNYACALDASNKAFCWGANNGKLGNGGVSESSSPAAVSGGLTFQSISTGNNHTCGVAADASLWCWGANGNGQLGAVSQNGSTVPLRAGGSLRVSEVSAAGVSTGFGAHTCAISSDRLTTYCFGRNDMGQLGNGSTSSATTVNATPTVVVGQRPL